MTTERKEQSSVEVLAQLEQIQPDKVCIEDDGCPTEKAVLQRFWREHQKTQPEQIPPSAYSNTHQPELTFDGLTPTEFALRELYEFQEATGCDTAAEFKAQPAVPQGHEQEPVGEVINELGEVDWISFVPSVGSKLYITPPQRTAAEGEDSKAWVGLTEEEIDDIWRTHLHRDSRVQAIEAKLKEKNT